VPLAGPPTSLCEKIPRTVQLGEVPLHECRGLCGITLRRGRRAGRECGTVFGAAGELRTTLRRIAVLPGVLETPRGSAMQVALLPVRVLPVLFGLLLSASASLAVGDAVFAKTQGKEILPWH
jgi:hypothetical protein